MTALIKALIKLGVLSSEQGKAVLAEVNSESKTSEVDDKVQDLIDKDPEIYMAETMLEIEGKSLAERRRVSKAKGIQASNHAQLCRLNKDGFAARKWNQIAWQLKNQK